MYLLKAPVKNIILNTRGPTSILLADTQQNKIMKYCQHPFCHKYPESHNKCLSTKMSAASFQNTGNTKFKT